MTEDGIIYENGNHWVARTPTGFEIYRNETTHAVRVASIGYRGETGRRLAIEECDRRAPPR